MQTRLQRIPVTYALTLCCCCHAQPNLGSQKQNANVAIIGAGVGGAFTAFNLRQLLNDTVTIHVYEPGQIGGRVQSFVYEDQVYESGASIVFAKNYYIRDAADNLGLRRVPPQGSTEDVFGIWDGNDFVFQSSTWSLVSLWRLISRYWLMYFKFQTPKVMLKKFLNLYNLQREGKSYETPEQFLQELDLYDLTQTSMRAYIKGYLGTSRAALRFGSEFVAAVNKVNYNQANTLNAFAGMVSMLPTVVNDLFKISGGNAQVAEQLLQHAHVKMHNASVTEVLKLKDGSFQLKAHGTDASESASLPIYSMVVIATPLELTNIRFEGLRLPHIPARKYQSTISTFVRGHLSASYFGTKTSPQGAVMVTEQADSPFSSLAPAKSFADGTTLYKLFSTNHLGEDAIGAIFAANYTVVGVFPWSAYPVFDPPEQFAPFKLAEGLFYNYAIETAASCMEISAVSAMNTALLVQKALNASCAHREPLGKGNNLAEL